MQRCLQDSYQQLKIFQDFLKKEEEQKMLKNQHLERVQRHELCGRHERHGPKFFTPPPPTCRPPPLQRQQQTFSPKKSTRMSDLFASQLQVASLSGMPSLATLYPDEMNDRNKLATTLKTATSVKMQPYVKNESSASLRSVAKRHLPKSQKDSNLVNFKFTLLT